MIGGCQKGLQWNFDMNYIPQLQGGKANSLPPGFFFEKLAYNKKSTRIAKFDVLMIIRILETTLFWKNIITFFATTSTGALQNLHFWAYKMNNVTPNNKEPIVLRELVLLHKVDPT